MAPTIDDLFPPSDREFYGRAPLIQTTCQVRFPHLLAIESQPPAKFQEAIRATFPLLERGNMPFGPFPPEVEKVLGPQFGATNYQFLTTDRNWIVTLAPWQLSLQTTAYRLWKDFRSRFTALLAALNDIYAPSFFSRVGLQYRDAINRTELGLDGFRWSELIRSEFFSGFGIPEFEEHIESMSRATQLRLPDDLGKVTAQYGYAVVTGKEGISYLLDFDFFKEGTVEVGHVGSIIDQYNTFAGRAFRSCMHERLRTALDPGPVPDDGGVLARNAATTGTGG